MVEEEEVGRKDKRGTTIHSGRSAKIVLSANVIVTMLCI
jgi:hypothetical protein